MCGRYTLFTERDLSELEAIRNYISRQFGAPAAQALPEADVCPGMLAPVLLAAAQPLATATAMPAGKDHAALPAKPGSYIACLMKWGYLLTGKRQLLINARAETAAQKPLFAADFKTRRCAVPATGFYEWESGAGRGRAGAGHCFFAPQQELLYLAGLYHGSADTGWQFVILTQAAAEPVKSIHARMPLLLTKAQLLPYLGGGELNLLPTDRAVDLAHRQIS
ncbi:MAG: SOS response-associated peptidase family protein [Oscillospiraceae bacterium]|nr:SOS response-associated peptidase family protein [Oscillospiraceae bacterium]MDD4367532.1 SOS response-associated peptidase family protein [Oscillospiraceae bacterium]